jgi:hypothetical protein
VLYIILAVLVVVIVVTVVALAVAMKKIGKLDKAKDSADLEECATKYEEAGEAPECVGTLEDTTAIDAADSVEDL